MLIRRPQDIGALVKSGRGAKGLNQQQLADRLGVSRWWVNELEGGKATSRLDLVLRALNELEIAIAATMDGDDSEARPQLQATLADLIDIDAIADTGLAPAAAKKTAKPRPKRP